MSVKIMSQIWQYSKQEGTALLMILAIADHANDEGICWPSVKTLAKKCRLGTRHATRLIQKLEAEGEIEIDKGGGRGHSNLYKVTPVTGFIEEDTATDRVTSKTSFNEKNRERVTSMTERVSPATEKGDIAMSPESLRTIIKPSGKEDSLSQDFWLQALAAIQDSHYRQSGYQQGGPWHKFWFPTEYGGRQDGKFIILCEDEEQRQWLEDRGTKIAENALVGVLGERVEVEFVVNS